MSHFGGGKLGQALYVVNRFVIRAEKNPRIEEVDFAERELRKLRPEVQDNYEAKQAWSNLCLRVAKVRDLLIEKGSPMHYVDRLINTAKMRIIGLEDALIDLSIGVVRPNKPTPLEHLQRAERALGQLRLFLTRETDHDSNWERAAQARDVLLERLAAAVPKLGRLTVLNAKEGDTVRAKSTIYDLPGVPFDAKRHKAIGPDHIHAEAGDLGVVVHAQTGIFPTVEFELTGTATMVNDDEAELL